MYIYIYMVIYGNPRFIAMIFRSLEVFLAK